MKNTLITLLMTSMFLIAPLSSNRASAMMGGGCGCGGSGPTCQTNQRVLIAAAATSQFFYHFYVLAPLAARYPNVPVYTLGYAVPAALLSGLYFSWVTGSDVEDGERLLHK